MTQLIDSQLIKNIIEHLINNKVVKNESDFCKRLHYATGNLAKIKNGERKIPARLVISLEEEFGFNRKYLSNDSENIVNDPPTETEAETKHDPEKLTSYASPELLATMVEKLLKIIEGLQKDNDFYRTIAEDYMKGQPKESVSKVQKVKA